jgi:predicted nucleic acid-binding protein
MSAERVTYLDSSAIVKLVVRERETAALSRYLRNRRTVVASALAHTEVARAVLALGPAALERAQEVLARIELLRVNDRVLRDAGRLPPYELRSLDAIHLASAALFGRSLAGVITYDARMAAAARAMGLKVVSPR